MSFTLRKGEILGIYGLVGAGRTELCKALFGARPSQGDIRLEGAPARFSAPRAAVKRGIALLTEDRKEEGLILGLSVRKNMALPSLDRPAGARIRPRRRGKTRGRGDGGDAADRQPLRGEGSAVPQRRQPAEGRHRQVAPVPAACPPLRRAHPRGGHRLPHGDLPPPARTWRTRGWASSWSPRSCRRRLACAIGCWSCARAPSPLSSPAGKPRRRRSWPRPSAAAGRRRAGRRHRASGRLPSSVRAPT